MEWAELSVSRANRADHGETAVRTSEANLGGAATFGVDEALAGPRNGGN